MPERRENAMQEKKNSRTGLSGGTDAVQEEEQTLMDKYVQLTHMKAWQVMREKTDLLIETAAGREREENDGYFYDIPGYLVLVCRRLRSLLGGITEIDSRNISLDMIYRIGPQAGGWKHIQVNEKRTGLVYDAKKFLENQEREVKEVIEGKRHHIYVSEQEPEKRGFFCTNVNFEGYGKKSADGCLLVTVSGDDFSRAETRCREQGRSFEDVLFYFVMPYFTQLLQNELGSMYLWKMWKRRKTGGRYKTDRTKLKN